MAYKKYFYKFGKRFGPYYYHSYREDGKVKKRYIGKENPDKLDFGSFFFLITVFIIMILSFFSILALFFYNDKNNCPFCNSLAYSIKPQNDIIWFVLVLLMFASIFAVLYMLVNHLMRIVYGKNIMN